jgi:hypothetical protein
MVARPAQAQLAGPAQVKIYKTSVQKSLMNLHECTTNLQFTQKFEHVVQFVTSTFGESSSRSATCSPPSPSSLLLLLLLLLSPPEPSSPDSLEPSPEVDPSGDAAVPSRFSFSLS